NPAMVLAIQNFAERKRNDGLAERTAEAYAWEAQQLARRFPDLAPEAYTRREVDAYLGERWEKLARATYKAAVVAIRSFFAWACGDHSPAAHVPIPHRNTVKPVRKTRSLNRRQCAE